MFFLRLTLISAGQRGVGKYCPLCLMSLLARYALRIRNVCAVVHGNSLYTTAKAAAALATVTATVPETEHKGKGKTTPFCVYQTSVCEKLYNKSQSTSAAILCTLCVCVSV